MKVLALLAVAALGSCPTATTPPNPPPPAPAVVDAGSPIVDDATPIPEVCISACSNMATLECKGVNSKTCSTALADIQHGVFVGDSGRPITCRCIAQAATRAGVEACGVGCR
jgi:hypothetical protein